MKPRLQRQMIAHTAARLIAEDGSLDYGNAKRKAARQLGIHDGAALPDNQAIEDALRSYQSLYQANETPDIQASLRAIAIEYMQRLADHDPHLTGSVLNGTAGKNSDINLQLFTDDAKTLEFMLMQQAHLYRSDVRPGSDAHAGDLLTYTLYDPRATISLAIFPRSELRRMKRLTADGTPRRLRLSQLEARESAGQMMVQNAES